MTTNDEETKVADAKETAAEAATEKPAEKAAEKAKPAAKLAPKRTRTPRKKAKAPEVPAAPLKERHLVLSRDVLSASARLTGQTKQIFSQFVMRFRRGVEYPRLPLTGASVYERIVLSPEITVVLKALGDMVVLLWAGDEGSAATWAGDHRCEVNPHTGELQVYFANLAGAAAMTVAPAPDATVPRVRPEAVEEPAEQGEEGKEKVEEAAEGKVASQTAPSEAKAEEGASTDSKETAAAPLFAALTDADLMELGLPDELLADLRKLTSAEEFEACRTHFPQPVFEALTWLLQGESRESVLEAYGEAARRARRAELARTAADTATGLDPSHFHVVTSDEELRDILERPLEEWRVFLHPSQREIVEKAWYGPVRVTGGAGTGKTVVALHRARHLVRLPDWKPKDKVLFTTFTKNLALDLAVQLKTLCSKIEANRIQVVNIDAWLATFVRQNGGGREVAYPGAPGSPYELCWEAALERRPTSIDLPESFYRSEWEEVVLPNHCMSSRDYFQAPRAGRGQALSRAQRRDIWPVFEEMRAQLQLRDLMTVEDACDFAERVIREAHPSGLYRAVIADEIQDFKPDMLKLLRALALDVSKLETPIEGDLFLVGDPHQRIYVKPVAFSSCGIQIRGRSKKLRVNYRTTDEIRKTAESVYARGAVDDMEGGTAEKTGYASLRHGAAPEVFAADSFDAECDWIADRAKALAHDPKAPLDYSEMCVVLRTRSDVARYEEALRNRGIQVCSLTAESADDPELPGLRTATMHRVKGLEFKAVFVAGMNEGVFPLPAPKGADAPARRHHERLEKALFYVSASRASQRLFFSASGKPSRFLPKAK